MRRVVDTGRGVNIGEGYIDQFYVRNTTNKPLSFGDLLNVSIPPKTTIDLLSISGMSKDKINRSTSLQDAINYGWVTISKTNPRTKTQNVRKDILADSDGPATVNMYASQYSNIEAGSTVNGSLGFDATKIGFYGTAPITKQSGVAVSAAGIHAALVNLGLIGA